MSWEPPPRQTARQSAVAAARYAALAEEGAALVKRWGVVILAAVGVDIVVHVLAVVL